MSVPRTHPLSTGLTSRSALVSQLRSDRSRGTPVWFMRQAGRSLPEYRALRSNYGMLESCLTPEVAAEITLQPVRRHGVDAAVFFSDIVVPLLLAGIDVDIVAGVGPVVAAPIASNTDADGLRALDFDALAPIREAMAAVVDELGATPVVAFGGAPFTLASYLVEGGPSRDVPKSRAMMAGNPDLWATVLEWCADITAVFIEAQVTAGASVLQVFDSWAGKLTAEEYRRYAAPYSTRLFSQLQHLVDSSGQPVPRLHFGVGTAAILPEMLAAGATAMGVDGALTLAQANTILGGKIPLQGNIDVGLLEAEWPILKNHVLAVVESGQVAPGHVVNLSHGVPKDTNPDVLTKIVELVHEVTP